MSAYRLDAATSVCLPTLAVLLLCAGTGCGAGGDDSRQARINKLYHRYARAFAGTPELTVEALIATQEVTQVVVVDVREKEEQAISMIPGAVTRKDFERSPERFSEKAVVAYCTIGARSGRYAAELRKRGVDAYNLRGSILSWVHAGQPVVSNGTTTNALHVYGRKWDLAPAGYATVWFHRKGAPPK